MKTKQRLVQIASVGSMWLGACWPVQVEGQTVQTDAAQAATTRAIAPSDQPISDAPLSEFQRQLLELAMQAATQIPVEPHIKDRSRAQEDVVAGCLELNQAARAVDYVVKIADWRRGAAYADLAFYSVQHGNQRDVEHYLTMAAGVAQTVQDWRRDRINMKIARTRALMGQHERAEQLSSGVGDSERGKLDEIKAMLGDEAACDRQLASLETIAQEQNFELMRNALDGATQLFNKFYGDADRRERAEKQIKASWGSIPVMVRIELMKELASIALDHNDQAKALELVNQTQAMLEGHDWSPEYRIATAARIAAQRHKAGDVLSAQREITAAMAQFDVDREKIMGIDRAGVWRAIAESQQSMGNTSAALEGYRKAVELGADNPNGRPRALDLSATCRSMALSAVEPDSELWARLQHIREGLTHPW